MTSGHRERILTALGSAGPMCDDCLGQAAAIYPRQTVNIRARELVKSGLLRRAVMLCPACRREKLVNEVCKVSAATTALARSPAARAADTARNQRADRPWYWEGNVQATIVKHLIQAGYRIESAADTLARSAGKDIVAVGPDGRPLWVSVKGFPEKSVHVQARHWIAGALLDMARYREESDHAALAIGLPDGFPTFRRLIQGLTKVRSLLGFGVYWVARDGAVMFVAGDD